MNDNIPELKIEMMADEQGGLIILEQDSCGNLDRVAIHSIHLRYMAEKMGLMATSDPQALKTIAALQRRMLALRDRIESLADWMAQHSDYKHADLSHETTQLNAMADLAREWCHEFEDEFTPTSEKMEEKKQAEATQLIHKKASPDTDSRQLAMEV